MEKKRKAWVLVGNKLVKRSLDDAFPGAGKKAEGKIKKGG